MNDQTIIPKKPLWRRILRRLIQIGIALFIILLLTRSIWNYVATRQLRTEIAKIRAAGEPLTFKELGPEPTAAEEAEDAGRFYAAGLALLGRCPHLDCCEVIDAYHEAYKASATSQPTEEIRSKAARMLKDNRLALDLFDKAADYRLCFFDFGVDQGIAAIMPRLAQSREMARLLSLRTHELVLHDDPDATVDSLICALRAARMYHRQPVLIVFLVRVAVVALVCQDVPLVLEQGQPSDQALISLQETLADTLPSDALTRTILAERIFGLSMMSNVLSGSVDTQLLAELPQTNEKWPVTFESQPWLRSYLVGYLRDTSKLLAATRKPWPQCADQLTADQNILRDTIWGMPTGFSSVARSFVLVGRTLGQLRSMEVAVAIKRYQYQQDDLPRNLKELVPHYIDELPQDPFTGKDLLYRHDHTGYVVYSIGENRKDDGGMVDKGAEDEKPTDWGIRIRLPSVSGPGPGTTSPGP